MEKHIDLLSIPITEWSNICKGSEGVESRNRSGLKGPQHIAQEVEEYQAYLSVTRI